MRKIDIIGLQMDLGASRRGVDMGPLAIRHAGLHEKLTREGLDWWDAGDIIPGQRGPASAQPNMRNFGQIVSANEALYHKTLESLANGRMPIVLGGDHSVAAGSIPAVRRHFGDIGVIWVDAHGDFNDDQSSETGNMHGMPFSAVCGRGPAAMVPYAEGFVNPRKCVQIGARDVDRQERERLRQAGVTVFSMTEIDKLGLSAITERAIAITTEGTRGVHVSFDVDAVTPEAAPGVGTPVHSGLTAREAFLLMEMLHEAGVGVALDMVEVNPILDERNATGNLACELILSLLGKALF